MQIRGLSFGSVLSIKLNPKALLNLSLLTKLKEEFRMGSTDLVFLIHYAKAGTVTANFLSLDKWNFIMYVSTFLIKFVFKAKY